MGDFSHSLRSLRRQPGYVVIVILTMALGIGVNGAIFSIVDAMLLRPLPLDAPENLVSIQTVGQAGILSRLPLSYPNYVDYRDQNEAFSSVAAFMDRTALVGRGDHTSIMSGAMVSGNFFLTAGLKADRGRTVIPSDDQVGAEPVIVLNYSTWKRRFGGDEGLVGQSIIINGTPHRVVGIAQRSFAGMYRGQPTEFWAPIQTFYRTFGEMVPGEGSTTLQNRGLAVFDVIGRLKAGITVSQATGNLDSITKNLARLYPGTNKSTDAISVIPLASIAFDPAFDRAIRASAVVVMALAGIVLLIACANMSNLVLARAMTRRREIAIRAALGEHRNRLIRSLLTESVLLSLAGGAAGLALTAGANRMLNVIPFPLPIELALGLETNYRVVGYMLIMSLLTGIVFGLAPARQAFRVDVISALKDDSIGHTGGWRRTRMRNGLVIAQVTLSLVLLIFAGLAGRSLMNAGRVDPGFKADGLVVTSFATALQGYDEARGQLFYSELMRELRKTPGVQNASLVVNVPLTLDISFTQYALPGHDQFAATFVDNTSIWPGYFQTMQIPMVQGREFQDSDGKDSAGVAIINEAMARELWPNENALGKQILVGWPKLKERVVIGIVRNSKYRTLGENPRPFVYTSLVQDYVGAVTLMVRSADESGTTLRRVRNVLQTIAPNMQTFGAQTMLTQIEPAFLLPRYAAGFFGVFGVLGIFLAVGGLYGVISYSVSQRTREIGIRMALGGRRVDVIRLVVFEGLRLTSKGIVLGLGIATLSSRTITVILYGVAPTDAVTFGAISMLMVLVSVLACYIPARRATRVDVLIALRHD